jgi:hypothetical protein
MNAGNAPFGGKFETLAVASFSVSAPIRGMPGQPEEGGGETLVTRSKDEIVAETKMIVDSISISDPN